MEGLTQTAFDSAELRGGRNRSKEEILVAVYLCIKLCKLGEIVPPCFFTFLRVCFALYFIFRCLKKPS